MAKTNDKTDRSGTRPRVARTKERTGSQTNAGRPAGSTSVELPGFADPKKATYDLYRTISAHPTVAMVMRIVLSPILKGEWSWVKRDESVPDEWVELIENTFIPMEMGAKRDGLESLAMGWSPFELIWDVVDGRLVITQLKPLAPDITEVLVDDKGHPVGLRNRPDGKPAENLAIAQKKAWFYTYDGRYGNPYGRSRHENIRKVYCEAEEIAKRLAQYMKKVSGVITQLHYPEGGTSKDENGTEVSNFEIAQRILAAVAQARSVCFPNLYSSEANAMQAADLAGKSQWVLSTLDVGTSDHASGLLETLKRYDALFFRGWLRPERTGLESEHGSRADSETHTDTAIADAELIDRDFAAAFSRGPVDMMLEANFGPRARGAVYADPAPISDSQQINLRTLIQNAIQNKELAASVGAKVDWDKAFEDAEIPIVEEKRGPIDATTPTDAESHEPPDTGDDEDEEEQD